MKTSHINRYRELHSHKQSSKLFKHGGEVGLYNLWLSIDDQNWSLDRRSSVDRMR